MASQLGRTRRLYRTRGGEAGIGKTVLLQEFLRCGTNIRILWGTCDALFTPRPLAPLHDIARQTQGDLLAAINSHATREQMFNAVLDELERERTLLVFEDMHWADEASLDLLKYLGRRIHRTQSMLAVTYRDDEVGPRHPSADPLSASCRAQHTRMFFCLSQNPPSHNWQCKPSDLRRACTVLPAAIRCSSPRSWLPLSIPCR